MANKGITVMDKAIRLDVGGEMMTGKLTMKSFAVYRDLTGRNLLTDIPTILRMDEGAVLAALASTLYMDGASEPIGRELMEMSDHAKIGILLTVGSNITEIIVAGLPEKKDGKSSKKKKN